MTVAQMLIGGGILTVAGTVIAAWFKFKSDSRQNENTNWGAIVEGYKEQVSYFVGQVKDMRTELREATERYERVIDSLEKERDHYKELYLLSEKKNVEWKEKYEALNTEIMEIKRGGIVIENESKGTV